MSSRQVSVKLHLIYVTQLLLSFTAFAYRTQAKMLNFDIGKLKDFALTAWKRKTFVIAAHILENYGWYILFGTIVFLYVYSKLVQILAPVIDKYRRWKSEKEYSSRYHKGKLINCDFCVCFNVTSNVNYYWSVTLFFVLSHVTFRHFLNIIFKEKPYYYTTFNYRYTKF